MSLDPEAIGLKVGIELHRQLNTKSKLFCTCPTIKPEGESESRFYRMLRVTESELGEIDPAALFEAEKGINIEYIAGDKSSCLVEADEEPPHDLNEEALDSALIISLALHSDIVDEVHIMRKIVIDGSNTTGFQRTMVIGMNGYIEVAGKRVGVQTICLEEDAARLIERKDSKRVYHLDRLGIPLIEVSLEPVTGSPEEVEEIALSLGRLLKASKRVARGLGTVRQDVNISIKGGGIVEVKGVQKPELVRKVIYFEAKRQLWLLELAKILKERRVSEVDLEVKPMDVTYVFLDTESSIIKKAVKRGAKVLALKAKGFTGLLKEEPVEGARLGRDLADLAGLYGFAGIFHSDELPAYGISYREVQKVKELLNVGDNDAFILLVGEKVRAETCMNVIKERLKASLSGPPSETRASTPEGKTRYLRPRPGSARMYPETDIPPIPIWPERLRRLKPLVPEPWEKTVEAYSKKFKIGYRLAENLLDQERNQLFERITREVALAPTLLAATLTETLTMLEREGVEVSSLNEEELMDVFRLIDRREAAKEAIPDILRALASGKAKTAKEALEKLGLKGMGEEELSRIVDEVIAQNLNIVEEKGKHAFGLIMGRVMAKVRGKIDGAKVSEAVKRKLEQLENTKANA